MCAISITTIGVAGVTVSISTIPVNRWITISTIQERGIGLRLGSNNGNKGKKSNLKFELHLNTSDYKVSITSKYLRDTSWRLERLFLKSTDYLKLEDSVRLMFNSKTRTNLYHFIHFTRGQS